MKQRQMRMYMGVFLLVVACVGGIVLLSMLNGAPAGKKYAYTTENDIWYVANGRMEIAAAQAQAAPEPTAAAEAPQHTAAPNPEMDIAQDAVR